MTPIPGMNSVGQHSFNNKQVQLAGLIIASVLAMIWIAPGIFLFSRQYSVDYDYIQNVRVAASQKFDHLLPVSFGGFGFIPEHQAGELLRLLVVKVTGLSVEAIQFLPVGAVLVPLTFYVLSREFLSAPIAALLSISVAFDPTVAFGSYHTSLYGWSRPLLLAFLFLFSRILRRKSSGLILLAYMVFVAAFSIYWTGPALIVYFSIFANILLIRSWLISRRSGRVIPSTRLSVSISVAFLITYLGFSGTVYQILPQMANNVAGGEFAAASYSLLLRVLQLVGYSAPDPDVFANYGGNSLVNAIQLARYVLMIVPVAWLLVLGIRHRSSGIRQETGEDAKTVMLWSLVGMLLFHTMSYAAYGHASTRYIALLGPLVGALALEKTRASIAVKSVFAMTLGLTACLAFSSAYFQLPGRATWAEVLAASEWHAVQSGERKVISNVGTYGMLSMEISSQGAEPPQYDCFSPTSYQYMLRPPEPGDNAAELTGHIVIDMGLTTHELCPGFQYYEALSPQIFQIEQNVHLDSVYNNGAIVIFSPRQR